MENKKQEFKKLAFDLDLIGRNRTWSTNELKPSEKPQIIQKKCKARNRLHSL